MYFSTDTKSKLLFSSQYEMTFRQFMLIFAENVHSLFYIIIKQSHFRNTTSYVVVMYYSCISKFRSSNANKIYFGIEYRLWCLRK